MQTILMILGAILAGLGVIAVVKKPGSVYRDNPGERNPLEEKRVRFVENVDDPMNADGVCGHLEAIGETDHRPGLYERYVKRCLDILLSFLGLVLLSPVFLGLSLWIVIDDPGPILFIQKRIGTDKQYFKLHNVSVKVAT